MEQSKIIYTLETYHTAAVGISLRYETKVIEPVGEPSNTT